MGFQSFSTHPVWSRLFKVGMIIWYILAGALLVIGFAVEPWVVPDKPVDYTLWSATAKLGWAMAAYMPYWLVLFVIVAPWLFLLVMRLLRNTIDYILTGSTGDGD